MTTRKVVLLTGALLTCRHFEEVDRRQWRRGAAQHPGYARDAQSGDSLYGLFMYSYRNCRLTGDAVVYLIRRSLRLEICTGTGRIHTVRVLYEGPVPYRHVKSKVRRYSSGGQYPKFIDRPGIIICFFSHFMIQFLLTLSGVGASFLTELCECVSTDFHSGCKAKKYL